MVARITTAHESSHLRNMPPATTTAVPLQGDRLSRPARRPGCQPNAGPQRLGGGTPRSSGSCAPQSRARPSFFACPMISSPAAARRCASCLTAAPVKRRPSGIGVGDQKQSPTCGALYAYAYTLTLDRHQPMTSARVLGALLGRGLMTGSAPYE